ncbi:hypothetical protein, partial [Aestuariivirga sp.]|uniref:hypothetical protein n=1 Tax=Aestuariivirga sp. TaxID=2650926 RepID=UPI003015C527
VRDDALAALEPIAASVTTAANQTNSFRGIVVSIARGYGRSNPSVMFITVRGEIKSMVFDEHSKLRARD